MQITRKSKRQSGDNAMGVAEGTEDGLASSPSWARSEVSSDHSIGILESRVEEESAEPKLTRRVHSFNGLRSQPLTAWIRPLARPVGFYLVSRLAVLFAVLASEWLEPAVRGLRALASDWDGVWYLRIAQYGYPNAVFNEASSGGPGSRWTYLPAFPAAIRATHYVTT